MSGTIGMQSLSTLNAIDFYSNIIYIKHSNVNNNIINFTLFPMMAVMYYSIKLCDYSLIYTFF